MIAYERYRSGNATYLVVDATNYVRNRRAFARRHCDSEEVVPDSSGQRGADGVLFLALEPEFRPPRVVMTLVRADGQRKPVCPAGVRCAAAWTARRTDADRVMVDTQAGTREAVVHDDPAARASIEVSAEGDRTEVRESDPDPNPEPGPRSSSGQPAVGVTDGGRAADGVVPSEDGLTVTRESVVRESSGELPEVEP